MKSKTIINSINHCYLHNIFKLYIYSCEVIMFIANPFKFDGNITNNNDDNSLILS